MAATFDSTQIAAIVAKTTLYPIDWHGKYRLMKFDFIAAAAGVTPSVVTLVRLPPGRIRVLPAHSRLWHSAFGASLVLDIGFAEYKTEGFVTVVADDDALTASAIDISSAGNNVVISAAQHQFDLLSIGGVDVIGTVTGGDVASGDELHGYMAYLHE